MKQRLSAWKRHKDRPTRGCATNGVEQRRLDELAQRKHVEIHEVHWENKWMGSLDFGDLNKTTSRTAGRGLKTNKETTNETSGKAKQVKQGTLGC